MMISYGTHTTTTPRVTFWGAAQSVTGSMHLVEVGNQRLLLDCGMARGERETSSTPATRPPTTMGRA